jgi:hypothetical protein
MNTANQPLVRYRTQARNQPARHLELPQFGSNGHRPTLHLNPDVAARKLFNAFSDNGSVAGRSPGSR